MADNAMVEKKRILIVADVSAENVLGGAERMLANHVRALVAAGFPVTVLTRQPSPDAAYEVKLSAGVREIRLPWSGDRGRKGLLELKRGAAGWWRQHKQAFDLVISEQPFVMWALLRAGCRLPRLQACHSFAFEEYATRHALEWNFRHALVVRAMRRIERKVYGSANRIRVLSRFMQERVTSMVGVPEDVITVIPGGAEMPELATDAKREEWRKQLGWQEPVLVTLRNLVPRTGVDMLVQAVAMLKAEGIHCRCCVIGDGPLAGALQALAMDLGVIDRIQFPGFLPNDAVQMRLAAADLFILPTRSLEGFGLVTIEANAAGLPVVATPAGANAEVVGSLPYNRVAERISPEAIAVEVRRFLQNRSAHASMAAELVRTVQEKYSWKKHDAALIALVESL